MELLGREINVAPVAAGRALSLKNASGVTFICTGADTFTVTVADSFAGSFATPGNIITRRFTNTATNGSAPWVKNLQAASNVVTIASGAVAFHVDGNSLPDTKTYIKVTPSGAGLVTAVFGDLVIQRSPDNLPSVSA